MFHQENNYVCSDLKIYIFSRKRFSFISKNDTDIQRLPHTTLFEETKRIKERREEREEERKKEIMYSFTLSELRSLSVTASPTVANVNPPPMQVFKSSALQMTNTSAVLMFLC
jgi:hypothetical protein